MAAGALRVIEDKENPIRGNLFASACRELLSHLLHRLGPDDEVRACPWFKQAPDTDGPTRAQRAKYAAQGGLPDKLIEERGYDEKELLKPIVTSIKKLNGYVHVRPGTVLGDDEVIDGLRAGILTALGDLFEAIKIWRDAVSEVVQGEVDSTTVSSLSEEVLDEVDILSTHHQIEHVEHEGFEVSKVGATMIELIARGEVYVELQYGSMSDWRRGDGAKMDVNFPFAVVLTAPISDMTDLAIVKRHVDTSSWYGFEQDEEGAGEDKGEGKPSAAHPVDPDGDPF